MIRIEQGYAKLGVTTEPSDIQIKTRTARLETRQHAAQVEIDTQETAIRIDQYEVFAAAGLKNSGDIIIDAAEKARLTASECIRKYARDGDRLAAIELGGSPLAEIAKRDAFSKVQSQGSRANAIQPSVTVSGKVSINVRGIENTVTGDYTPASCSVSFKPALVDVYIKQKAFINTEYQEESVDVRL